MSWQIDVDVELQKVKDVNNTLKHSKEIPDKENIIKIKTMNGETEIEPIFCEAINKQIGWQTIISDKNIKEGIVPAYFSLQAIDLDGNEIIDLSYIETC